MVAHIYIYVSYLFFRFFFLSFYVFICIGFGTPTEHILPRTHKKTQRCITSEHTVDLSL